MYLCPLSVDRHCRVEASQILTVLSLLALARDLPSRLHFTALTSLKAFKSVSIHKNNCFEKVRGMFLRNLPWVPAQRPLYFSTLFIPQLDGKVLKNPECPLRVDSQLPVVAFQSLMVLSPLPEANVLPSGPHATDQTLTLR